MRIEIRVDRTCFRRWHTLLRSGLERKIPCAEVRFRLAEGANAPPGAVASLLALERLILLRSRASCTDVLPPSQAEPRSTAEFAPEVIVDCTGAESATDLGDAPLVLRPLFDGAGSEQAMMAALLSHVMPQVAIEDRRSGAILASGHPSSEAAQGLTGGMDAVLSRAVTLIERVLISPREALQGARRDHPAPTPKQVARFALRNLAMDCARAIYHLCFLAPHWRIGWRLHDGPGVLERGDIGGLRWNVLGDPGTRFFADPFPVTWEGRTFVFFEDLEHRVGKGTISAIEFDDHGPRGDVVPVLEEPWHMSYPFVLEHEGALWMVPESSLSGCVPIYRCTGFPNRWERAGTLLEGIEAADCTIFRHAGLLWMMSAIREGLGGYSDTLAIHYASELLGSWHEHSQRPVLVDVGAARPAGAVTRRDGQLWRPIQDCTAGYGRALSLARIDRLDPDHYAQTICSHIRPGALWPGGRLHTLNRLGRLELIDGTTYNPRFGIFRPYSQARMAPGGNGTASQPDSLATS